MCTHIHEAHEQAYYLVLDYLFFTLFLPFHPLYLQEGTMSRKRSTYSSHTIRSNTRDLVKVRRSWSECSVYAMYIFVILACGIYIVHVLVSSRDTRIYTCTVYTFWFTYENMLYGCHHGWCGRLVMFATHASSTVQEGLSSATIPKRRGIPPSAHSGTPNL